MTLHATDDPPTLSIIVPVYNEVGRFESTLPQIAGFAAAAPYPVELLVVEESVGDVLETLAKLGAAMAIAGIFPQEPHGQSSTAR